MKQNYSSILHRISGCLMMAFLLNGFVIKLKAQSPQAIPYQAVARSASGSLIVNQNVALRFSIHDLTINGAVVFQETQNAVTNSLGLFMVNIGQGIPVSGTFAGINWGSGSKFIQVELDAAGGTNYINMGTTQLMSVPYALFAAKSGDLPSGTINGNTMHWNGITWVADNAIFNDGTKVGIGTITPSTQFHTTGGVRHQSLSGTDTRAVYSTDNGTLTNSIIFNEVYTANSTGSPIAIPDNSCTGASSTIQVAGMPGTIPSSSISVKVNITHPYVGDLRGYLYIPNGGSSPRIVNLFYANGGSGDNFINTVFTDSAVSTLSGSLPPYTGFFKPLGNTSTGCSVTPTNNNFSGMGAGYINPNGSWTLKVIDLNGTDVGSIVDWSISFQTGGSYANAAVNSLLPSQGGHSNGFLTTTGADPSWTNGVPLKYYMVVNGSYPSLTDGCTSGCVGSILMFSANAPFNGDIQPCNGQLLSIAQYTPLYTIIGTTYGGNGSTTFALPNFNGPGQTVYGKQ